MKTKIFTFLLLAIPFFINAQDLTIASGATVTIGPGASMTTGKITNNAGVVGLVIESDATAQGTLIFDDNGTDPEATVEIYIKEATANHHWTFVSPMTTNAKARDFYYDVSHDAWLIKYRTGVPQAEAWWPIGNTDLDTTLLSATNHLGIGYAYIWRTNPTRENVGGTVSFKGPITAKEVDVKFLHTDGVPAHNFHLIGNPFSATYETTVTPPGIENSYWIWDSDANNYLYGSHPDVDSTLYPPSLGTLTGFVAMGQSFFVRTDGNANYPLTEKFLPEHRKAATTDFYKKSSNNDDYFNHIMLLASKGEFKDRMFVTFADDGTEDFEDGYDISKFFGGATAPQLYMNVQDRQQSINYIASLTETEERIVPFGFRAGEDGEQTFTVTTEYLIDAKVSLEDTKTGEMIDLMENPVYTFKATPGDSEDRFLLHFNWSPTGIEDPIASTENAMGIYAYDKAVYISNKDNNFNQTSTITIHDMYGRMVYSDKAILIGTTRIPLQLNNAYLVVRVRNANGVYTNKVFIK